MGTTSKVFSFLSLLGILGSSVFASSPFDIILSRAPDIAVTDIHQETNFVYMRVCNLGGSITDSDTSLALAMKKSGGGIISIVEPIILGTNECHEFRIASLRELGISRSEMYDISAGALLKDGRTEKVKYNNKLTRSVNIVYPSRYTSVPQAPTYYTPDNTSCNSLNNYCSSTTYGNNNNIGNSTTYYCIPGTSNCSTTPYTTYNNNAYCNTGNNNCTNTLYNGSNTYYRSNICPPGDVACNNSYYNSTNTPYQNNNTYCTYSNSYCNNNTSNYNYNFSNTSNYNNSNYNSSYIHNVAYELPDLVVQKLYQNSLDKHIIAQICNVGGDMRNSASVRTNFVSSNSTANMYNTLQMARGQCTSSVVYSTPAELGLVYGGNYSVIVTVDVNNAIGEWDEINNTLTQQLFVETDRNQKSDLVVDRIYSNESSLTIIAHVCNIGDDMLDYNNWILEITNTTSNSAIRNSGQRLSRGQCTEVSTSYASLGIYGSWGYNIRVILDPDNAMSEQSRSNNTLSQYLQLRMNY